MLNLKWYKTCKINYVFDLLNMNKVMSVMDTYSQGHEKYELIFWKQASKDIVVNRKSNIRTTLRKSEEQTKWLKDNNEARQDT